VSAAGGTPSAAYCASGPAGPGGCIGTDGLSQADWSSDGTKIAAIRYDAIGQSFLETAQVGGLPNGPFTLGAFTQAVDLGGGTPQHFRSPRWLADSQRIVLDAPRVDQMGFEMSADSSVWIVDPSSGANGQWFPSVGPASDTLPVWGPTTAPSNAAQVTSPVPSDVTISLSYTCPNGQIYPVATDVPASQVDAVSATFFAGFDPTTSCGGAPGTLGAVASDGFSLSTPLKTPTTLGTFTPTAKPPTPNIDGPLADATYGPGADVVLSGRATSPQGDSRRSPGPFGRESAPTSPSAPTRPSTWGARRSRPPSARRTAPGCPAPTWRP